MEKTKKSKLNKKEISWILYDVGNSAFTMLACALIPIWFKNMAIGSAPGQISSNQATAYWAFITSAITVFTALIGPVLGAFMDYKGRKKVFFIFMVTGGAAGCILTAFTGSWISFMILFVISKVLYTCSQLVYDAMLCDITTQERMDEVSSYGYGLGYIGSCVPFLIALGAYVLGPDMMGKISNRASMIIGFGITAIWWFGITIPLMKEYKQIHYIEKEEGAVKAAFADLGSTLNNIFRKDKKVLFFLIAFFLYIDGVGTIIDNCVNIGTDLGLSTVGQVVTLVATQVVAFIFSLVFVRFTKKYKTVMLIEVCILGYFCVCLYALTLHDLIGFGILALGVGMFQGSIQSLSRSYYTKIIPPEKSGGYFGIYDIFSKGASFLGSAVLGIVKIAGGTINIAVASMAVFFFFGFIFLKKAEGVRNSEGQRESVFSAGECMADD